MRSSRRTKRLALPFADAGRTDWHYTPRSRPGLSFADLDARQRELVHGILKSALSEIGHRKAVNIIELELVLREMEYALFFLRDPEKYSIVFFGAPDAKNPWGWRFEGHHLSLSFTIRGDSAIATTPSFFGANPAEVARGPKKGLRTLGPEEDEARKLLGMLEGEARKAVRFAWAGPTEKGKPHYYRIQGLKFLIEYDASQGDGNHIHTVWRDFEGDFGRDLLREHHAAHRH